MARAPSDPEITVFRGWLDRGKHVWSPFVTKLELRLRLAGVPYAAEAGSLSDAPKGKLPYMSYKAGETSFKMGDSTLISRRLTEEGVIPDLNARLSGAERAQDLALRTLLEDKLYFIHNYELWEQNYYVMRDHILASLPWPMRVDVGIMIYRDTMAHLRGQGIGRHSAEEISLFRDEIWQGVADTLIEARAKSPVSGNECFWVFGGDAPTEADTTLFGFIVAVTMCAMINLWPRPASQESIQRFPIILDYAGRIQDKYFADYEKWVI